MRAMILAAGLGTRLEPLTSMRPKPALPVRGIPLISYSLFLLARYGVTEVMVNLHHLPHVLKEAALRYCPPGLSLRFSEEADLLDTGGGIRKVAGFLRESDPCLLIGGDMLLDVDLGALIQRHRECGSLVTMLLKEDPRGRCFGTLGVDRDGRVRRIGSRLDLGGEVDAGVWTWANVVSSRAFDAMPDRERFVFLDDWIGPMLSTPPGPVRGELARGGSVTWEPVGTFEEYLAVNLTPRALSFPNPEEIARAEGARFGSQWVVGAGAQLGTDVALQRAVVWDGEQVPDGLRAENGVFAGGRFHTGPGMTAA